MAGPWVPDAEEYGVVDPGGDTEIADVVVLSTNQQRATARHIARHDPARVLAEVAAKREVVRLAERAHDYHETFLNGFATAMEGALRMFAIAYADHPDYQPEWAPPA